MHCAYLSCLVECFRNFWFMHGEAPASRFSFNHYILACNLFLGSVLLPNFEYVPCKHKGRQFLYSGIAPKTWHHITNSGQAKLGLSEVFLKGHSIVKPVLRKEPIDACDLLTIRWSSLWNAAVACVTFALEHWYMFKIISPLIFLPSSPCLTGLVIAPWNMAAKLILCDAQILC